MRGWNLRCGDRERMLLATLGRSLSHSWNITSYKLSYETGRYSNTPSVESVFSYCKPFKIEDKGHFLLRWPFCIDLWLELLSLSALAMIPISHKVLLNPPAPFVKLISSFIYKTFMQRRYASPLLALKLWYFCYGTMRLHNSPCSSFVPCPLWMFMSNKIFYLCGKLFTFFIVYA